MTMTIPSGLAGVRETLKVMHRAVKAAEGSDFIRNVARELVANERPKSKLDEIGALFEYIQNAVRYLADPVGIEQVDTARQVLLRGAGDCDDKSVALASLLQSIGHRTRFTAMGFKAGSLSHVVVDVLLGSDWTTDPILMLDATEDRPMGWRPPGAVRLLIIYNDD